MYSKEPVYAAQNNTLFLGMFAWFYKDTLQRTLPASIYAAVLCDNNI